LSVIIAFSIFTQVCITTIYKSIFGIYDLLTFFSSYSFFNTESNVNELEISLSNINDVIDILRVLSSISVNDEADIEVDIDEANIEADIDEADIDEADIDEADIDDVNEVDIFIY
jgi:hypothetical protein